MFAIRKIVVPVDFSERSAAVAPYAKAFAEKFQAQLFLIHVEHSASFIRSIGSRARRSSAVQEASQVEAELETMADTEFDGFSVSHEVLEGDPAAKIVEYARTVQADLIMMPTRGCGPYRRFLLGSVTAKVLHDSECPVWTSVHIENALPAEPVCRKVACAVDLGPHTTEVLSWASRMASGMGAELLLVHATSPMDHFLENAADPDPRLQATQAAREAVQELLRETDVDAEIAVSSGPVCDVVYRNVAQFSADLLVIGRHAASGMAGRLHPHAYSIIRESPCPGHQHISIEMPRGRAAGEQCTCALAATC